MGDSEASCVSTRQATQRALSPKPKSVDLLCYNWSDGGSGLEQVSEDRVEEPLSVVFRQYDRKSTVPLLFHLLIWVTMLFLKAHLQL